MLLRNRRCRSRSGRVFRARRGTVTAVEVRDLSKRYGDRLVVNGVSFSVGDAELVSVLGPSGCGKTTILRCVAGLLNAESGRIAIAGRVVYSSNPHVFVRTEQRAIGLVYQDYALWPHLSVRQHLRFPMESRGVAKAGREAEVARLLALVQLEAYADRRPGELSGGQQQRVAIARALAGEPRLLLMDEPMSNLDARLREQMRSELVRLVKGSGIATLYVTHDQAEAMSISDRIIVLREGGIVQQGSPAELYQQPADLGVAEFLGIGSTVSVTPGAGGTLTIADGPPMTVEGFDTTAARRVVVPVPAVHPAEVCRLGVEDETVLGAVADSASYEGGAWLIRARLPDGQVIEVPSERPVTIGIGFEVHLVARRILPFTDEGRLCPKAGDPVGKGSIEVTIP